MLEFKPVRSTLRTLLRWHTGMRGYTCRIQGVPQDNVLAQACRQHSLGCGPSLSHKRRSCYSGLGMDNLRLPRPCSLAYHPGEAIVGYRARRYAERVLVATGVSRL